MNKTTPSTDKVFDPPAPDTGPRARIFAVARDLFYRQGIRGVGVDAIASEAQATKMTLYRAFQSKDALVAECLREAQREFGTWWDDTVRAHAADPREALLELFRGIEQKADTCQPRGCPIGNAAVEVSEDSHPARRVIVEHNADKRARLLALTARLGVADPGLLADGLLLLMHGSYMARLTVADGHAAPPRLVEIVRVLLDGAPRA